MPVIVGSYDVAFAITHGQSANGAVTQPTPCILAHSRICTRWRVQLWVHQVQSPSASTALLSLVVAG